MQHAQRTAYSVQRTSTSTTVVPNCPSTQSTYLRPRYPLQSEEVGENYRGSDFLVGCVASRTASRDVLSLQAGIIASDGGVEVTARLTEDELTKWASRFADGVNRLVDVHVAGKDSAIKSIPLDSRVRWLLCWLVESQPSLANAVSIRLSLFLVCCVHACYVRVGNAFYHHHLDGSESCMIGGG